MTADMFTRDDLLELASVFVRSNTPRYFFNNVRQTRVVEKLVGRYKAKEIIEEIRRLAALPTETEEAPLVLAALLGALTFYPQAGAHSLLSSFPRDRVPFGEHFLYMVTTSLRAQESQPIFGVPLIAPDERVGTGTSNHRETIGSKG